MVLHIKLVTKTSVQVFRDFDFEKRQDGRWVGGNCRGINGPGISSGHFRSRVKIGSALLCILGPGIG